ncbi:MAG: methylmalonyl-CoA mutase family protein [Candidatus Krumholzibacteria bacterium]|jgi:methylmalonyl-CoA mutase N-terminal domain/subunit|nr:methylmalonyl-CoA mutase family protein [Candidatus Krumholzibacteria bacterium]
MPEKDRISSAVYEWLHRTYAPVREKSGERKASFSTTSGIPVAPVYTPLDAPAESYIEDSGLPGEYPFTRGIYPTMYRGKFWTMRQYAGFGSAEETNERFRYLLERGQTGLSVAFDLPTQMGYDSDHRMARGEVGRVGVAIDTLDDFRSMMKGIPLDRVSTSMTINATAAILLAMYAALAEENGVPVSGISGTIQNDILKEYYARGTYIYPPSPSMRIITDIFSWCRLNAPKWNTISISGYHIREAGSTAVQEIAFTLSDAVEYIRAAVEAGLEVDEFAPRLSFFFCVHNNIFEEVAKFRAARRIYARIMKERFGASNEKSCLLRFHTQTAGCSLTAQQIENNVVRVAMQALAAVLGGTQSLHTNSRDEALNLPSEEAALTALRTQQLIAEESGVCETMDPLGGSYFVEKMTRDIEEKTLELMSRIEEMGGMTRAIEMRFPQNEIERSAYAYQKGVENGDIIVVGVNRYKGGETSSASRFSVDPGIEKRHVERLCAFKSRRSGAAVDRLLGAIEETARGKDNLLPPIIEAVKGACTLGEISATLEKVFGRYDPGSMR